MMVQPAEGPSFGVAPYQQTINKERRMKNKFLSSKHSPRSKQGLMENLSYQYPKNSIFLKNHFCRKLRTQLRFATKAQGDSEMAYCVICVAALCDWLLKTCAAFPTNQTCEYQMVLLLSGHLATGCGKQVTVKSQAKNAWNL